MRFAIAGIVVLSLVADVSAQWGRGFLIRDRLRGPVPVFAAQSRASSVSVTPQSVTVSQSNTTTVTTMSAMSAMSEVNAARVARGLRPYVEDQLLTQGALRCAMQRAAGLIRGHTPNDFAFLPAGVSASAAGCGALEASWGWQSCCTYDRYTYAGAAVVIGRDGRRYMHLFVR
jgi:hypothetical protein